VTVVVARVVGLVFFGLLGTGFGVVVVVVVVVGVVVVAVVVGEGLGVVGGGFGLLVSLLGRVNGGVVVDLAVKFTI